MVNDKELVLSLDAYHTSFQNQIVVDYENPRQVSFYNLQGESYSNSYQVKLEYELFEDFNIRTAYRYVDAKTTFGENLLERPMVSKHRAFINLAHKSKSDWHIDATLNWIGSMRLPDTSANPAEHQRRPYSPSYFLLNGQIMKRWEDGKWDVYLGVENLLNYRQTDAIIAGGDPFGEFFDASLVWAPLFGTNVYIGFRYNLPYKKDPK